MNNINLVGRITKDPELRYTANSNPVVNFTLAINNGKDKDADFINCVVWGSNAENLSKYTDKGSLISVEGSMKNKNYEKKDGTKVYTYEVLAFRIQYLDNASSTEQANPQAEQADTSDYDDPDLPF